MSANKENILYDEDGEEEEEEEEEEVFFGPVGEKEKKKLAKYSKRKTILFTPGFRNDRKLMRYSIDQSNLGTVSEEMGCKGEEQVSNDRCETDQTPDSGNMHRLSLNANDTTTFEMSTLEPIGECEEGEDNALHSGALEINGNQLESGTPNQNNNNASIADTSADLFDSKENSPCVVVPKSPTVIGSNGHMDSSKTVSDLIEMLPKLDISHSEESVGIVTDSLGICQSTNCGENTSVVGDSMKDIQDKLSPNSPQPDIVIAQPTEGSTNIEESQDKTDDNPRPDRMMSAEFSQEVSSTNSCHKESTDVSLPIESQETEELCQDLSSVHSSPKDSKDELSPSKSPVVKSIQSNSDVYSEPLLETNGLSGEQSTAVDFKSLDNGTTDDLFKKPSVTPVQLKSVTTKTPSSVHSATKTKPVIQAPNSGKKAFKRSSTSAFQTTPKSGSKTTPGGSTHTPCGSNNTNEPGGFVFKETNFSPTLKVSDMKRPITLSMIPQMPVFGSQASLASFDGHERQIELDELNHESVPRARVVRESGRDREPLSLSEDEAIDVHGPCGAQSLPVYRTGTPR